MRHQRGRHEVDLLAELGGGRMVAFEVKADAGPGTEAAKHLAWLRELLEERFVLGLVLHTGPRVHRLSDRVLAAPIACLWG